MKGIHQNRVLKPFYCNYPPHWNLNSTPGMHHDQLFWLKLHLQSFEGNITIFIQITRKQMPNVAIEHTVPAKCSMVIDFLINTNLTLSYLPIATEAWLNRFWMALVLGTRRTWLTSGKDCVFGLIRCALFNHGFHYRQFSQGLFLC